MGTLHVGTSGWVYPHWRRIFYPEGLPAGEWLPYYARVFRCVELNATFYRLPLPGTAARWAAQVPRGFRFAVKGSRYLTHMRKLLDRERGTRRFFDAISDLGSTRGPILWQLPPRFRCDPGRLRAFLTALPKAPHAVELRDPSWAREEVYRLLDDLGAALVLHDGLDVSWPWPPPGRFVYRRFHGAVPGGRYGRRRLRAVARRLEAEPREIWTFFNNDREGHALRDALDLLELAGRKAVPESPRAPRGEGL